MSLFIDDVIVDIHDPKISSSKLLQLINTFRKSSRMKNGYINPVAFLYTKEKEMEEEIMETILFTIASKNPRYSGAVLTRKDFYNKNVKTMKKEIEKGIRRRKDLPFPRINGITRFQTLLQRYRSGNNMVLAQKQIQTNEIKLKTET